MSTVAPEVRGAQPAPAPPVRHGLCRLTLTIDGAEYRLTRSPTACAAWHLKKRSEPRAGVTYCVLTHKCTVSCTCPDSVRGGAVCKHVRALVALGLVSKRAKPEAVLVAQTMATATTPGRGESHA
jgi:hypothetical protein